MRAVFFLQLTGCFTLKLLESTYPTTPYKHVPLDANDKSGCANVETYATQGTTISACTTDLPTAVDPLSACGTAIASHKTGFDESDAAKVLALTLDADRCCQDIDATADDRKYLGWASVGLGKPRLDGFGASKCEGYSIDIAGPDKGTVSFFEEVVTHSGTLTDATKGCVMNNAGSGGYKLRIKVTAAAPTALTVKDSGDSPEPDELMDQAVADCGGNPCTNNKLIEYARMQCTKTGEAWWDGLTYAPTQEVVAAKDIVCGGFCIPTSGSAAVTFYQQGSCILSAGETGLSASAQNLACYSSLGLAPASVDMPKAFNDPKVVNLAGESFEILQTGTFQMVQVALSGKSLVSVAATIDRAGSVCGATYIQNVTVSGKWVQELGRTQVQVRAAAALPKKQALQVSTNGESWSDVSGVSLRNSSYSPGEFSLHFKESLSLKFSVDSHRIVEGSKKTRRFANFLNLDVKGLKMLSTTHQITGVLSAESHTEVAQSPDECANGAVQFISKLGDQAPTSGCPLEKCGLKPTAR